MRRLYFFATASFWILVTVFWAASLGRTPVEASVVVTTDRIIFPAELAMHKQPEDCWMAIRGSVYDLSAYLPEHPSRLDVVHPWCGKEATAAYETKSRGRPGRPHSTYADELLVKYRIGSLASDRQ